MTDKRYHTAAIILHWLVALAVFAMLATGLYMVNIEMSKAEQFRLYQWHKALGVVVLWFVILRLIVRWMTLQPSLPSSVGSTHIRAAKIGHIGLYVAIVIMPLSGWLMVSASPFGLPTFVFVDWIKWPHIPYVARNKTVEEFANIIHWFVAYGLIIMIIGHIAALVYHKRRHNLALITRMWWSKKA